jgi:glycerol-3-phosphate acyltransferase PlsX
VSESPVTVALDGLGAEQGADVIVAGARAAAADGIGVRVFGDPEELAELDGEPGIEVLEARDRITNDDDPVSAVRSREDASIVRATADVVAGASDALASPGATGATMAAATLSLRRLHGVRRPALAAQVPAPSHAGSPTLFLDVGANTDARPNDLVQFAFLGAAFSEAVLGIDRPRVALLSIGEEAKKGTADLREVHATLSAAEGIEFAGNVEGRDLLTDAADVVVTDGFTGNVALKTMEGTARAVADGVAEAARSNPVAMAGGALLRPALGGLRRRMDPDQTGGAILLGLRGVAVVGHGSSGADGVANAIRLAARTVRERAVERTAELLERGGATRASLRDG